MEYIIHVTNDSEDEFEKNADNVGVLQVFDAHGTDISSTSQVTLFLSKNGLIGLGTELIRLAHQFEAGRHYHITPARNEMVVGCGEQKTIDEYE